MTVFGLTPLDKLPEAWTPIEAIVAVKCLDDEGKLRMFYTATEALNSWEALGMIRDVQMQLEDGLQNQDEDE